MSGVSDVERARRVFDTMCANAARDMASGGALSTNPILSAMPQDMAAVAAASHRMDNMTHGAGGDHKRGADGVGGDRLNRQRAMASIVRALPDAQRAREAYLAAKISIFGANAP